MFLQRILRFLYAVGFTFLLYYDKEIIRYNDKLYYCMCGMSSIYMLILSYYPRFSQAFVLRISHTSKTGLQK